MAAQLMSFPGSAAGIFGSTIVEMPRPGLDGIESSTPGHVSFGTATVAGPSGGQGRGPMGGPEHPDAGPQPQINQHTHFNVESQPQGEVPIHSGELTELLSTYDRLKSRFRLCSYLTELLASYKSLTHLLTRLEFDSLALQRVKSMRYDLTTDPFLAAQMPPENERVLVVSHQPTTGAAVSSAVVDSSADALPPLERSMTQPESFDSHVVTRIGRRPTVSGKTVGFHRAHTSAMSMNLSRDRSSTNFSQERTNVAGGGMDMRSLTRSPIEDPRIERLRNTLVPTYRLQRITRAFTEPTLSAIFKREAPRSRPSSRRPRLEGNEQSLGPSRGQTPAASGSRPSTAHISSKRSSAIKE